MISRQHKIDLRKVRGTGKRDRITKEDLINYIENSANNVKSS
jgi:pyruvate/2-oxoglutarate dehydrogenase complex dihydrolipoamide acyltransferase (E2) component